MFAAGSIKSSKWGWDVKVYPSKYGNTSTQASNVGYFTGGCLAPNGLIYCLPTYKGAQFVTVIKPGKSNSKTGKWEPATIVNVPAGGSAKTPLLPDQTSTFATLQRRFANKGILAPNGLIYFFGFTAQGYVVVKPQENPNFDIAQYTEWKVVTYASVGLEPVTGRSGYGGGFLHTDGKIYLLPEARFSAFTGTSSPIARMIPRSEYNFGSETIEKSAFWTPTSASTTPYKYFPTSPTFSTVNNFPQPGDIYGTAITIPADTYAPNYRDGTSTGQIGPMPPIGDAISHPNGNIYVFGGGRNAYILKLKTDNTTWNSTNTSVGRPLFYTDNDLRVPNNLPPTGGYTGPAGIYGCFMSGSIEKLKPGQNPETAKIYFHYTGTWENDPSLPSTGYFENNYTRTIVFDPVAETFESIGEPITTIRTNQQPFNLKPGVRMANGHIFCITNRFVANVGGNQNPYGQLIVSGELIDNDNKIIGPNISKTILDAGKIKKVNDNCYNSPDPVSNQGSHALTGSSLGKTFVTAPWAAYEITSVKGFYPGIRYFNYNENQDQSFNSNRKYVYNFSYTANNQITIYNSDITSDLQIGYPFYIYSAAFGIDQSYTVSNIVFSGNNTVITVSGTPFITGDDTEGTLTYGQLVQFPDNETLRIWGVDLTNSMYNVQNINIQGSPITGNNGVKTIYPNSQPFYDNGHTDLTFNPGTFTTSGVNPDVTASFQYAFSDSDIFNIPSDLSTLPTSLYNAYHNKPR